MQYSQERSLDVEINAVNCDIPTDERTRMQGRLATLGEAVKDFPQSDLRLKIIYHPRTRMFHAEGTVHLPGRTLFAGDTDLYLDMAFQRCMDKLERKVNAYRAQPDHGAIRTAERRAAREQTLVGPDIDVGPLADAVRRGDYRAFRL